LLIVTGIFPPEIGGPAKFAMEFGKWTSAQGFRVRIKTYSEDSIKDQDFGFFILDCVPRTQNILARYLRMIQVIGMSAGVDTHVLSVGAFLETYFASIIFRFAYVAKVPGDIVWERARNNGVTTLQIEDFQNEKLNFKYGIFRYLYTRSLKKARIVIVPSRGLYNLCIKWGVSESKLKLIHNSVGAESASKEHSDLKRFDLITVCRLAPWKGVDELIEYAANRDMSLLVIGDGPDKVRLQFLASKRNAKVIFAGEVEPWQVQDSLMRSKIFALNSYYEGLPHALVEARVAGVLTVGRAGTGSEEVINDNLDGFLIRSDRPLDETLDKAFSILPDSQEMITRAKADSLHRFNKATNFTSILDEIQSDKK
jgi:glycosyltransferase involved in cell wall biosynthesis